MRRRSCMLLLTLASACDRGETTAPPPATSSSQVAASSSAPALDASVVGDVGDEVAIDATVDATPSTVDATATVQLPLPSVRVANIGMHIGGGPNDDVTKAPIAKSVAPHFDAFRACYALLAKPAKVELGVDLTIEAAGGKALVKNPRSTAPGTELRDCAVKVFESIEFLPPKTGKTIVSYSLQFSPQK